MKTRKTDFGEPQPAEKRTKAESVEANLSSSDQLPPLPDSPSTSVTSSTVLPPTTKNISDFKPVIHPSLLHKPTSTLKMSSPEEKITESALSAEQKEDLEELKDQMKNLRDVLTFEHLAKDGSNFVDWREETSRTIYRTTGLEDFWINSFPKIINRLRREQNRAAMTICENTIDSSLRRIIRPCKTAHEIMKTLQAHFQKGGRTAQFAIFQKLVSLRPPQSEDDILEHTSKIDALIAELEATGFKWSHDSITGLFYQLNLSAETTKAVNKELDAQFEKKSGIFTATEIRNVIQTHMAREKIATETATMTNLAASIDALSVNAMAFRTPQRSQQPNHFTPIKPYRKNDVPHINWKDGPMAITGKDTERESSINKPLNIPASAIAAVKAHRPQCFYCSSFNHGYNECPDISSGRERTAAHYNDWRRVKECSYMYSLDVLFPNIHKLPPSNNSPAAQQWIANKKCSTNIRINAVESSQPESSTPSVIHASAINWDSDGIKLPEDANDVPTEYLFDGGATDAVSNSKSILLNYQPLLKPIPIHTASNDSNAVIVGKGDVQVTTDKGESTTIKNVYYCPTATSTIISPGALIAQGAKLSMNSKHDMKLTLKDGKTITARHKNRRWFITPRPYRVSQPSCTSPNFSLCSMKSNASISQLWHKRFGHVAMRRIRKLFDKADEYGLPDNALPSSIICDDCMKCKSTRRRVLSSTNREIGLLDVIVSDVAGPFTPCLTGERLMVTFRDAASTYSKAVIINNKSEVPNHFIDTIKQWERETGVKVKKIRTDRGGEYVSNALNKWLKDNGIQHEFSNPYEPEQNGIDEHLNRTIGEIARTLLMSAQLPQQFWHLAYLTAVYIHNRVPNLVTEDKTPYELFFGRRPQLNIIRTFGSKAFVHIHTGQRSPGKLEDRAQQCIMVGYVDGGKGWLFYDPASKTLIPSAIARFPYEEIESVKDFKDCPKEAFTSSDSINKILNPNPPKKGSLDHIINALKIGDFTTEARIDQQDVAAQHALDGQAYLKILNPPKSFLEAMRSPHGAQWKAACDAEMQMMEKMCVWKVIDRKKQLSPIGLKWVFAYKKFDDEGNPTKFKARLVAKGYKQREGIDYTETFAPTATFAGLRIMLTIAAHQRWPTHSFDISSAYLHSGIDSEVYFSLPTGYMCDERKKNQILQALKALYGTKQEARCWWKHIDSILIEMGFKSSQYNQSLYVYRRNGDTCIIWLHSDDGGVTGSSDELLDEIHNTMKKKLLIKWEKNLDQIVGVNVTRDEDGNFTLSQPGLTKKILKAFLPDDRKVKTPLNVQKIPTLPDENEEKVDNERYLSAIGSLNYLSVATRPDITYAVNYLARFSADPRRQHWDAVEHLVRYLNTNGVKSLKIKPIRQDVNTPLHTYVDANWGGEGAQSSHGFITFFLNCPVSWTSKRQTCVASSTCHAEYMAMGTACRDAIWIRNLVEDLTGKGNTVDIHCDNTSAIHVASDNSSNKRTRHTDREFYYINEQVYKGRIFVKWIDTKSQRADILTKPLGPTLHQNGMNSLRLE